MHMNLFVINRRQVAWFFKNDKHHRPTTPSLSPKSALPLFFSPLFQCITTYSIAQRKWHLLNPYMGNCFRHFIGQWETSVLSYFTPSCPDHLLNAPFFLPSSLHFHCQSLAANFPRVNVTEAEVASLPQTFLSYPPLALFPGRTGV